MIQKSTTADLKEGKNKRTQVFVTYIDEYSNEYESFGIDRNNLKDSEWRFEKFNVRRANTIKHLHLTTIMNEWCCFI